MLIKIILVFIRFKKTKTSVNNLSTKEVSQSKATEGELEDPFHEKTDIIVLQSNDSRIPDLAVNRDEF